MINELDVFYTKVNKGSGLKIVENKSGNDLELVKESVKEENVI